ncbi:MAG: Nucleoside diphosphate kinase [Candidatus Nomurabacteria bacterium GW2011_GWE1_32_28]|uniref:Nucleoside diphosphate kinase n=1 Tax=Candidatus Nomurabacteria bacterium GW2011_GWF1_31_48 TaxID=1618767 RepID=A0A0F9YFW9_9BACT|nr:MAG: Nucleoside diphosphate kinase [Candidatus Nomurabacteria bacterium GW2011_GWF2_30_133]KKP28696.1 MAG: Nucleoside diphosphate kinase [Candidatus Nomurabacteria bacterium GW2011_GWE2_31_40]KKP30273.1 MAG: Nucleoside diphosphate kinase [Candidatus Nomurabacteria bacterium GW2011_GWF1_31_48]KKP34800.1 MAG: Nucleoside diphosphate kinase [Candidatus Nomurabacteria bacterium GW2011_GWE1_32_28]HAS80742.1 nucleoside-diphosphate kinase [Candidatus Nomurabacteria bacterium]
MTRPNNEKSLIIIKPDAVQRNLVGEIISRFEKKGLKIIGIKMMSIETTLLEEHYAHIKDKPFFPGIRDFMQACPVIVMAVEGINAISAIRLIVGPTKAWEADAGTIRGDFSLSTQSNIVHASDSIETGEIEVNRFFLEEEIFSYKKIDTDFIYAEHKE